MLIGNKSGADYSHLASDVVLESPRDTSSKSLGLCQSRNFKVSVRLTIGRQVSRLELNISNSEFDLACRRASRAVCQLPMSNTTILHIS
jgi:hypothetical protein